MIDFNQADTQPPGINLICQMFGEVSFFPKLTDVNPETKPLVPADFQHTCRNEKDGRLLSPALFTGKRGNANFVSSTGICLDFDQGNPTPIAILSAYPGVAAILYSTHSHTPGLPRYRVVIPLSKPVTADEQKLVARALLHDKPWPHNGIISRQGGRYV